MKKVFPPYRAAASLLARLPKLAQRASEAARSSVPPTPAHLASAQPSPTRWLLLLRAAPVAAPRHDRVRKLSPRGDHASALPAAQQPRPAPAPTR